jgi:hypothetical protein
MNVRITDKASFEALQPLNVVAYVRSEGWKLLGFWEGKKATVWDREGERLVIPENTHFADYALRMAEVLDLLGRVEGRSQLVIYRDLTTSSSDVIRVRVASPVTSDGTLGLDEGVALFESTKEMILSAARAAVSPRAYYRSRLPGPADEYLKKVRMGQTERGSYVATVVCPVSPELQTRLVEGIEEPFDRKVTHTLSHALQHAADAARSAALMQAMSPFQDAVPHGVSSNLCSALATMGEIMPESQVEIGFSWARTRQQPANALRKLILPADALPTMREAARILKEVAWEDEIEVTGPVVRLDSSNPDLGGNVIVQAFLEEGGSRKVQLRLNADDYREAVQAHEFVGDIRCRGRIKKEGRYFTISEVHGFKFERPWE